MADWPEKWSPVYPHFSGHWPFPALWSLCFYADRFASLCFASLLVFPALFAFLIGVATIILSSALSLGSLHFLLPALLV
jgi:hypothetical protein